MKTFFTYAVATVQALGPVGLLGLALIGVGLTTLFPHMIVVH